jgi:hypothetical protein
VALALVAAPAPSLAQTAAIGLNYTSVTLSEGKALNGNNGYAPPDNAGAVGPSHVAHLINGAYAVYDKATGDLLQQIAGKQFWINAGVDPGNQIVNLGSFNQRIVFDPAVNRWIAAGLSGGTTPDGINNLVMIARSDSADPTGTWKAVSFVGNDGGSGKFADFTMLGLDADGVYVSTNNFPALVPNVGIEYAMLFSLPKADLLATTPTIANMTAFGQDEINISGFSSLQPIIDFGPSKGHAPLVAISDVGPNTTPLYRWDLTGTSGPGATVSEVVAVDGVMGYVDPPDATQPGSTQTISTIDGRIASHAYQVGDTIYALHQTGQDGNAALSVMIFDEPTNQLIQEITLADPDFDYFNGSIAANSLGDVVVGFTRSGEVDGGNLSAFALIGKTTAGVTTFGDPLLLQEGLVGDYELFNGRWGDWTSTVVDPSNPQVFWTFQQYALAADEWATQITQLIVPEPAGVILAALAVMGLLCGAARQRHRSALLRRG